jgi:uncharacterized cofD-like protein
MSKRYRIRRLLAPTAGFRKAIAIFIMGVAAFAVGAALSFKVILRPLIESLEGTASAALRTALPEQQIEMATHILGGVFLALGGYLVFHGFRSAVRHVWETLNPDYKGAGMANIYLRRQQLAQGPRIVALGGGTGLGTLLRGLKQYSSNITAIVTVTDDGGSSGILMQEKGIIPPGDIRNCMVALSDAETAMAGLFQYRFKNDSGNLSGHSVGNLLIAALVDMAHGDFEKAVEIASDVLAIRGRVVPSTLDQVRLRAIMENGLEICGETSIVESGMRIRRVFLHPDTVKAHPAAIEAIHDADLICIGPGSVYTSVIPNLLVPGIADAIRESQALKAYVCNVMTQRGESDSFTAAEHVTAIQANLDDKIFDYVLVNTGVPSEQTLERYRGADQYLVDADVDRIRAMGYRVMAGDFMNETDLVRHDPMRLANRIMAVLNR